jgi:hypothetical protein
MMIDELPQRIPGAQCPHGAILSTFVMPPVDLVERVADAVRMWAASSADMCHALPSPRLESRWRAVEGRQP